jgi:hypothetical protein
MAFSLYLEAIIPSILRIDQAFSEKEMNLSLYTSRSICS